GVPGAIRIGDPVHDHRVRRDAERGGKALVALGGRLRAVGDEVLVGDAVELAHLDTRLEGLGHERERLPEQRACACHPLGLRLGLADDHASTFECRWTSSSACSISRKTSSTVRSAWMPTTFAWCER